MPPMLWFSENDTMCVSNKRNLSVLYCSRVMTTFAKGTPGVKDNFSGVQRMSFTWRFNCMT